MPKRPFKRNYEVLWAIGRRLAAARVALEKTQAEISRALGCKPNTWSTYESGDRMPDPETMALLADISPPAPAPVVLQPDRVNREAASIDSQTERCIFSYLGLKNRQWYSREACHSSFYNRTYYSNGNKSLKKYTNQPIYSDRPLSANAS